MKAVVVSRFGGPEVLELAEVPVPEPGVGQLRIRVETATPGDRVTGMRDLLPAPIGAQAEQIVLVP